MYFNLVILNMSCVCQEKEETSLFKETKRESKTDRLNEASIKVCPFKTKAAADAKKSTS